MAVAAGVRFRAPTLDDARAVAALVNECERRDRGRAELTAAMVAAHWSERDVDLAADGLVAESEGRIVGYALATHDREFVDVAPDHEGLGIGSELLRQTMRRSAERGAARHGQTIGQGNAAAATLLGGAGYERVRAQHRMALALTEPIAGAPPDAIRIRRLDVDRDAPAVHRLDAEAFADNADYAPETFLQFCDEHLRSPVGDADATLVAVDGDGRIVGSLLAERRLDRRVGHVSVLGVAPAWHRHGVGTALLRTAFGIWLEAGVADAELVVASDNPGAKALYERLGMTVRYTLDQYERPVSSKRTI